MVIRPLRLVFDVADPRVVQSVECCEADMFTTWYDNSAEELAAEYGARPGTHWVAVLDARDRAVAASRLFLPTGDQTKTMDDVEAEPWGVDPAWSMAAAGLDPDLVVDIATVSSRPGHRKSGVLISHALMYGVFAVIRANSCAALTMIVDSAAERMLGEVGLTFHGLPGTRPAPYLGSASSRPVYAYLDELLSRQRRSHPIDYRATGLGLGIDGIAIPPLSAFEVAGYGAGRMLA